jgi:geranylgeranyl pyrophosphate synthase
MQAGGTAEQIAALEQYGFNLGLAFQITDDILDLVADSAKLGKTAGIDVAQGKGFAVAQNGKGGVAVAEPEVEVMVEDDPVAAFKRKLISGNYIQEGRDNARQLATIAEMSLSALPDSEARSELYRLARYSVERDY